MRFSERICVAERERERNSEDKDDDLCFSSLFICYMLIDLWF